MQGKAVSSGLVPRACLVIPDASHRGLGLSKTLTLTPKAGMADMCGT